MPINKSEVTYNLQIADLVPEFSKLSSDQKEDIKEMVGDLLLEEIETFLDESKSPVNGKTFKRKADGEPSQLYLTGDMRSVLEWQSVKGGIKVGIFGNGETEKAFAHNTGAKITKDFTMPKRQFIPESDQTFFKPIIQKAKELILNAIEDQEES